MHLDKVKRIVADIPVGTSRDNIAEIVVNGLDKSGLEIVPRDTLQAMRKAVESRETMALIGKMIEGAKPGDVISNWPPELSPPTGWRKESYCTNEHLGGGEGRTVTMSRIIKER